MGSGCIQNKNLSTCLDPISSDCVKYQGLPDELLGICTGDTITEVEQAIITRLKTLSFDGKDITLDSLVLDVCNDIKQLVGNQPKTVLNVIQATIQYACVLKSRIDSIQNTLTGNLGSGTIDFKCIPAPSQFTFTNAIQSLVTAHCNLKTSVDQLVNNSGSTTIIDGRIFSSLNNLLSTPGGNGLRKTVNNTTQQVSYSITAVVPPYTALEYYGPLSHFDGTGKGLPSTPYEGWYLCNGLNGTPDKRGVVSVGAVQGVPGGSLNPNVNPANDASMNYSVGQIGGNAKVTLSKANLPDYQMAGNVAGTFNIGVWVKAGRCQDSSSKIWTYGPDASCMDPYQTNLTGSLSGNTTVNLGGGGQSFDVRQPYIACNYIMRFD